MAVLLAVMGFLFQQNAAQSEQIAELRTQVAAHANQLVIDVDYWWKDEWPPAEDQIAMNESDIAQLRARVEDIVSLMESPLVVEAIRQAHEHEAE